VLEAGVRWSDAFVMRRCQILLANARGTAAGRIGQQLSCSEQAVRNAIRAFNMAGLPSLQAGSSVPHHVERAFAKEQAERLRTLLHQSPRNFGKPTSLWTLVLAAEVSFVEGLTSEQGSAETVRATLARLGIGWRRAKHEWLNLGCAPGRRSTNRCACRNWSGLRMTRILRPWRATDQQSVAQVVRQPKNGCSCVLWMVDRSASSRSTF